MIKVGEHFYEVELMESKLKKVLVLAAFYPPYAGVAPRRIESLVRHMPNHGWAPHVVTLDWNEDTVDPVDRASGQDVLKYVVHRSKLPSIRWYAQLKALPRWRRLIAIGLNLKYVTNYFLYRFKFGAPAGCNRFLLVEGEAFLAKYVKEHSIDLVLSTAPDLTGHFLASRLKDQLGLRWVADCRDDYAVVCPQAMGLEGELLASADEIVTVSKGVKAALDSRIKRDVEVIENGFEFDGSDVSPEPVLAGSGHFNLVYTGRFAQRYPDRHDPDLTMRAISELIAIDELYYKDLRVLIYGETEDELKPLLSIIHNNYPNLVGKIVACGIVDRTKALRIQHEADVLILLADPNQKGILTGKVFEYLASRNPILCIPGDEDDLEALLKKANAGYAGAEVEKAKEFIQIHYQNWLNGEPRLQTTSVEVISKYRRDVLAQRYFELMNKVVRS